MSEEWGFAPPPFKPDEAAQRLRRELRELGLSERGGAWERRGQALARVVSEDGVLPATKVAEAIARYGINADKINPLYA